MARLIHLNGPPGIGKSTLARRYAADNPGVLICDIDVLRTMIGGWDADFAGAGALIRPAALAFIGAYLAHGHDVVLPQLLVRATELERFEATARTAGAKFVTVILMDDQASATARFYQRGDSDTDPWHAQVRRIVADQGGDEELARCYRGLQGLLAHRPDAIEVRSVHGDFDGTYQAVIEAVGATP